MQVFVLDHFLNRVKVTYPHVTGNVARLLKPLVGHGTYLAGGSVLALADGVKDYTGDFDLFFSSEDSKNHTAGNLEADGAEFVTATDNAVTYKYKNYTVQLVHRQYYATPEDIFNEFDMTICMWAIDFEDKPNLYSGDYTILDTGQKEIVLHNVRNPASTMKRLAKYAAKGYVVTTDSYIRLVKAMAGKDKQVVQQLEAMRNGETYD